MLTQTVSDGFQKPPVSETGRGWDALLAEDYQQVHTAGICCMTVAL